MLSEELKQLGLNKNEAIVYATLASLGQVKAGLVIDKTKIHRNLVYQALEALQKKNLVIKSQVGNVAAFQISDPSRLLDLIYAQEITAKRVIDVIQSSRKTVEQEIQVFEGKEAVANYWFGLAKRQQKESILHIIGSGGNRFKEVMGARYVPYFEELSRRGGAKILMHEEQGYDQPLAQQFQIQVKQLETTSPPAATIGFVGDEVIFALYSAKPVIISIRNQDLADVYGAYFEMLWNQHVRVETGWDAFERSYATMLRELEPGDVQYSLGASDGGGAEVYAAFYEAHHAQRIRKGVRVRMLSYQEFTGRIRDRFVRAGDVDLAVSEIKSLPGIAFGLMEVNMYKGRVVIEIHGDEPTVITIKDEEVYKGMRQYFDDYWNMNSVTYHGEEGAHLFMADVLTEKDIYWIGGNGGLERFHPEVWDWYKQEHKKIGDIRWHDLIDPGSVLTGSKKGVRFYDESWTEYKYLPRSVSSPHVTCIYGNKVANIVWGKKTIIHVVDDAEIAESQKKYFQYLWDQNTMTLTGDTGVEDLLHRVLEVGEDLYLLYANGEVLGANSAAYTWFTKERARKGTKIHMLAVPSVRETAFARLPNSTVRYLPKDYESPMVVWIFGDYVANVLWRKPQTIYLIQDKETADVYRKNFEALKKTAKP